MAETPCLAIRMWHNNVPRQEHLVRNMVGFPLGAYDRNAASYDDVSVSVSARTSPVSTFGIDCDLHAASRWGLFDGLPKGLQPLGGKRTGKLARFS